MFEEVHTFLTEVERNLRSASGNIGFAQHTNATREGVPSYYEDQFYHRPPTLVYNKEQGLYYTTEGPALTPGKRDYPVRYLGGKLDGSQPEFYYNATQQVEYSPIYEAISETEYRVRPTVMWPQIGPFYLYLAQKNGEETYRYVKINDEAKIHVASFIDGVVTFTMPLTLNIPVRDSEEWQEYQKNPFFLAFFRRRVDHLLKKEVVALIGDDQHPSIHLTTSTEILEKDTLSSVLIRIADVYIKEGEEFVFTESNMETPVKDQEVFILIQADSGTILKSDRVTITNVTFMRSEDELVFEQIDPSNPFLNIDVDPIDDPLEGTGEHTVYENLANVTGKITYRYFTINFTPYLPTLEVGQNLAYFEETLQASSKISDEELSVELFGNSKSLRPHSAFLLNPLKAPSYTGDIYGNNWAAPFPYPVSTHVDDGDEANVNGYIGDDVTQHRMVYDRTRNVWTIGGKVSCICRNFQDANVIEDCFLHHQYNWYFKIRQENNDIHLYHLAVSTWT